MLDSQTFFSAGTYPVVINARNNFPAGHHNLTFDVTDALGLTAKTSVNYELSKGKVSSNSEFSL